MPIVNLYVVEGTKLPVVHVIVLSLFESATAVHLFVDVSGVAHVTASVAPVHVYNVTFVVLTVPTVSASLAVISTNASIGTND